MNSTSTPDLRGLWVPLVTPFDTNDDVDLAALRRLCDRVLADGARGVVALGTTGEPAVLSEAEQRSVVDTCAESCATGRRGLIVGAGTNSTRTTIEAVRALDARAGVTAALVVVPYYTRPSGAAIVEHYRAVAEASPVPIVAYNVPYRTGRGLTADEVVEIANIPNVVGLKQAVGCLDADTLEVLRRAPRDFQVLAGDDAFIAPTILMGGVGAIAAASHVCTPLFVELVDAALSGNVGRARTLGAQLLPVVQAGFSEPNPAVWKAVLYAFDEIATPNLRAPLSGASTSATTRLVEAVTAAVSVGSVR
jgi:4-hydroxy-tetrahydrodipicolinate synthase